MENPLPPDSPPAILPGDPLASIARPTTAMADPTPTEDGSEIRVLVVYTPAMQSEQGGNAGMQAVIDLLIHSANQAFEISGISPRLVLAHTALVDYVEGHANPDLGRLSGRDDGYMDEVHALRNEHAADLVHLLTRHVIGPAGIAWATSSESLNWESTSGFAISAIASEEVFSHEIGHNLGLRHDRYSDNLPWLYPYGYGYVNNRAFEPGAPVTTRWSTIMAYPDRCSDARFRCLTLLRFANPDQTYRGDPLGVPADDPATGPSGPADARLTINRSAPWVGSFRSEACTEFAVSPETPVASVDAGEVVLEVETAPGCLWEASSQSAFLAPASDARHAGTAFVTIEVEANQTDAERIGTISLAGKTIEVRQLATDAGICSRSPAVVQAIADYLSCTDVTDQQLSQITDLHLGKQGFTSLKAGDLEGLSSLQSLNLDDNRLAELPQDLFAGLANLEFLYLGDNQLRELPDGLFTGLSKLRELTLGGNALEDLPQGLFANLSSLRQLVLAWNDLTRLSEGQFSDLANLEELDLAGNELTTLPDGLLAGLVGLKQLDLGYNQLAAWSSRTLAGLSDMVELNLSDNQLSALPEDAFAGLVRLKNLDLGSNPLATPPTGLFTGLAELQELSLWNSGLTRLPDDIFAGLSRLIVLRLGGNEVTTLPDGIFSGLAALQKLRLNGNQLNSLPSGVFVELSALKELDLARNQLSSLPDGIFSGLTSLETLFVGGNHVDPLPLGLTLKKVGDNRFKVVVPTGAPFGLSVPVSSNSGTIEGNASTVTMRAGAVESSPISVARIADMRQRVTVDMGILPDLPATHSGYVLKKDAALPLSVLPSIDPADAALSGLSLNEGTLDPIFAPDTLSYKASVANAVSSTTVTLATGNLSAAADFRDESDAALPDADANAGGHQVSLNVGENVIKVKVTAENGASTRTYTIIMTRDDSNCNRSAEVLGALMEAVSGVAACGELSSAHLAEITILEMNGQDISSLKSGDFAGLSALETLVLDDNQLTALPADVFSGLTALRSILLSYNQLESLPDNVFSGLSELRQIAMTSNRLSRLPDGIFSGISRLSTISLANNQITSLAANAFSGLSSLQTLLLGGNELTSLPADVFSGLSGLEFLGLSSNELTSLRSDVFSGLSALQRLFLGSNQLTSLPDGLFVGLTELRLVKLYYNTVDPLPISVSLETIDRGRFKAVVPIGAPFALELPLSISSAGEIEGGADVITIPAGAVESPSLGLTRIARKTDTVTLDIGMLPPLPKGHDGYALEKDATLPIEISLPEVTPPPAQVTGVEVTPGIELLEVAWTAVPNADGYKVQWKSGEEDYDETRQAVISGADATTHTITGLTAGTEYTIRVIATRANADDGPASAELAAIPQVAPLAQVEALEVRARLNQLLVSWTAVADAGGYKVQWKSGEADYDETRLAVIAGADRVSYTITELTAGTEYTIRVIATGENVEDGPPSEEVIGTPRSADPDVNGDGVLDGNDALVMNYAYVYSSLVGDGETGGTAESRQRFLAGYSGRTDPSDEDLQAMLRRANAWRAAGVNEGGDINDDGVIDGSDSYAMYYAYAFESLLGNGDEGGTARFRSQLLGPLAGTADPTDEDLKDMLRRANRLREEFNQ